jgi:hypothetical protein
MKKLQWRDDPEFAQALRSYVDNKVQDLTAYGVTGLATSLPPADARTVLLQGLDSPRPYAADNVSIRPGSPRTRNAISAADPTLNSRSDAAPSPRPG